MASSPSYIQIPFAHVPVNIYGAFLGFCPAWSPWVWWLLSGSGSFLFNVFYISLLFGSLFWSFHLCFCPFVGICLRIPSWGLTCLSFVGLTLFRFCLDCPSWDLLFYPFLGIIWFVLSWGLTYCIPSRGLSCLSFVRLTILSLLGD